MLCFVTFLLFTTSVVRTNPIDRQPDESSNEIDHSGPDEYNGLGSSKEDEEQLTALPTSDDSAIFTEQFSTTPSTTSTPLKPGTKGNPIGWFLAPLIQRIQLSPQTFLQDRLGHLKETLGNLTFASQQWNGGTSKQLGAPNGLLHLIGINEPGFYTNRLEPAGFLGGNGWLANKGGILGGPGALLSTGSLLTDYPTAYRK